MAADGLVTPDLLRAHDVFVVSDNGWQQRARLLQALWRERQGLPAGPRSATDPSLLGSRLRLEDGEPPRLRNYLSAAARGQVLRAVADASTSGALLSRPRLWVDLLSSQPLCFNLFGPLADDLETASLALGAVWPDRITRVTRVAFEFSPGRRDPRYTGNRSAFDVFVEYDGLRGPGFLGVEVKYHENLVVSAAADPEGRYLAMAAGTGAFKTQSEPLLTRPPLQQLWLDHLLALRLSSAHPERWAHGGFVLLYPEDNMLCARAAEQYRECLSDGSTFEGLTLERLVGAIRETTDAQWIEDVQDRYFDRRHLLRAHHE